jgi:hypothetical protein
MREQSTPNGAGAADAFGAQAPLRAPRRRLDPRWIALTVCLALVRTLLLVHSPSSSTGQAPPYTAPASPSPVGHALHNPPARPSCEAANISTPTADEGVCTRGAGLPGPVSVYNVVDRSHVLRMPEYEARLLGSEIAPTHTRPGDQVDYPDGRAKLVSFELAITNTGKRPLLFEPARSGLRHPSYPRHPLVELLIPESPHTTWEVGFPDLLHGHGAPGPSVFRSAPIPAHGTVTGWVSVVASFDSPELMGIRPADLVLYRTDGDPNYMGQIRLWK